MPVSAASIVVTATEIEYLGNGDYIETVIIDIPAEYSENTPMSTTNTITKAKTTRFKNSGGTVLWSVTIKATFTYNGTTSKCTRCSHSTTSPGSGWSIQSASHSRLGNKATATATAVHSGATTNEYTRSVTIKCSPNGTVS